MKWVVWISIVLILTTGCSLPKTGQAFLVDQEGNEVDEFSYAMATMDLDELRANLIAEGIEDPDPIVARVAQFQEEFLEEKGLS